MMHDGMSTAMVDDKKKQAHSRIGLSWIFLDK